MKAPLRTPGANFALFLAKGFKTFAPDGLLSTRGMVIAGVGAVSLLACPLEDIALAGALYVVSTAYEKISSMIAKKNGTETAHATSADGRKHDLWESIERLLHGDRNVDAHQAKLAATRVAAEPEPAAMRM